MTNDSISGLNFSINLLINESFFQPCLLLKLQIIYNTSYSSLIYLHQCDYFSNKKPTATHSAYSWNNIQVVSC